MEPGSTGGGTGNALLDIVIVLALILAGGFFAASEIALITVKRHRLRQLSLEGSRASRVALRLTENPSRFLATAQIGMTFLGFLASAVGAVAFSHVIADAIRLVPLEFVRDASDTIAFVLMTMFIALASIIIGELVPKTLALSFTERLALLVAHPINFLDRVLSPIVWFVSRTSLVFVKALGGKERPDTGYLSTEELKILVETGSERGDIEEEEKEMIHGVIELGDKSVHEVMVPRIGIRAVDVDAPLDEVLDLMMNAGHSRVPVYSESLDNVVGILYAKDLLPYLKTNGTRKNGGGRIDVRKLVREPVYVPETKRVDELLREMQQGKTHMAIVVDEYGGTAGLITMEDLVEEIVGEIQDEYDTEETLVEPIEVDGQQAFRVDGRVSVDDLRDLFDLPDEEEPDEDAYDTVGGLIINRVGRIPLPGAEVTFRDLKLTVEAADPRRVAKVLATRDDNGAAPANAAAETRTE
ncbi:MAG: hemolysin family protein [Chloroflexota bacterium]|nr:hemolysin family protein [Chloroflexota bacterium]